MRDPVCEGYLLLGGNVRHRERDVCSKVFLLPRSPVYSGGRE